VVDLQPAGLINIVGTLVQLSASIQLHKALPCMWFGWLTAARVQKTFMTEKVDYMAQLIRGS